MNHDPRLMAYPLYHSGQVLFMVRDVKELPRAAKVKVRRWHRPPGVREVRYEVEYEGERYWCYEYDLGKTAPD